MPNAHVMSRSRAIPVDVNDAFCRTLPIPLPELFSKWYGPIAPIKAVLGQTGEWQAAGQTRTVTQVGGGSMQEELTRVDAPNAFAYRLTDIAGPLAPLVDRVDGEWRFEPIGTGTLVTWRWTVYPKSALAALALPVFARIWGGFANQSLAHLSDELLRS